MYERQKSRAGEFIIPLKDFNAQATLRKLNEFVIKKLNRNITQKNETNKKLRPVKITNGKLCCQFTFYDSHKIAEAI